MVDHRHNQKTFKEIQGDLKKIGKGSRKVAIRSLNKTLPGVRTDLTREIRKEVTLGAKEIRSIIKVFKAHADKARVEGAVMVEGEKRFSLMKYRPKPRQTKLGVKVKVKPQSSPALLRHAFIATMKSGHEGVFWRRYKGEGGTRLPIHERFGPHIATTARYDHVISNVLTDAAYRYYKTFSGELDRELEKVLGR